MCSPIGVIFRTHFSFPFGIKDGNPDVNSVAESEWTVVRSVFGIQLHVPKWDQSVDSSFRRVFYYLVNFITVYLNCVIFIV